MASNINGCGCSEFWAHWEANRLDWDWNNVFLAGMGAVVFFGALWEIEKLKKHLHMEDLTPTRRWKKAIRGPKYRPIHKSDQLPEDMDENVRRFFRDYGPAVSLLNQWNESGPLSFENTGRIERGMGGEPAREVEMRYNQQKIGWIRFKCFQYGEDDWKGDIKAELLFREARRFSA